MISITMNKADLKRVERMTESFRRGADKVMSRAINKVTARARKKVQQFVQKATGLKQKETRIWKISGKRRATKGRLQAILGISAFRPSLSQFKPIQLFRGRKGKRRSSGVSVRIGGKRKKIMGAWKWVLPGERVPGIAKAGIKRGVFKREGNELVKLKGPSSAQLYADKPSFARQVEGGIGNDLLRQVDKEIKWLLETGK